MGVRQNNGVLQTDQVELVSRTTAPTDSNLTNGRLYYDSVLGGLYAYINSAWVSLGTGGAAGVTSWDGLYDNDKTLDLDGGVLTFIVTTAANGLYLNKTNAGAGVPLVIANSGSGYDMSGPAWSIISTGSVGILELTSGGTINATGGALTIGKTATATTFVGTITVSEGATFSDGTVAVVDNSNTAGALTVTNATLTTFAGLMKVTGAAMTSGTGILATFAEMTTGKGLSIVAAKTTEGSLLYLSAVEAVLTTGLYVQCFDGATTDFSVGRYGATIIAGVAASNVFTITAGDVVLSDTSITLTDADDAASLVIVNNAGIGTNAAVVSVASSGTYVGNTTKSFLTLTPSGLTTGTGAYLPLAAVTTGKGLHITAGATQTTGSLLYVQETGAESALTSGTIATFDHTATAITATVNKIGNGVTISASRTITSGTVADNYDLASVVRTQIINTALNTMTAEGAVLYVQNITTNTAGTITDTVKGIEVVMDADGSGAGVHVTHSAATGSAFAGVNNSLTTGDLLSLTSTSAVIAAGTLATLALTTSGSTITAKTGALVSVASSRTELAAAATADDYDVVSVLRTNITNTLGTLTAAGSALKVAVVNTQTAGTLTATCHALEVVYPSAGTGNALNITDSHATTKAAVLLTASGATSTGSLTVVNNALTTGTAVSITTTGTIVTTGDVLSIEANTATTSTGLLRVSGTSLTDGFVAELTGATTATATGGVLNLAAGAATDGSALRITTSGVYIGTVGVVDINAAAATSGVIVDIGAAGLTTGTALKITATEATLSSGKYVAFYDGAANDFSVGRYGATVIAGNASGTAALTLTNGDILLSAGNITFTAGTIIHTAQAILNANTAISVTHGVTKIANNAASTHAMADGVEGQKKTIVCTVYAGNAVITPTNLANGATITLGAVGGACDLVFLGTEWWVTNLYGTATLA